MTSSLDFAIFVIHYSKLSDRKSRLDLELRECGFNVYWVTEKDIDFDLNQFSHEYNAFGINSRKIAMDRSNNSRSLIKSRRYARLEGYLLLLASYVLPRGIHFLTPNPCPKPETQSILELSLMHIKALQIARQQNLTWALFIEDDAVLDWSLLLPVLKNLHLFNERKPVWCNVSAGANLSRTNSDPLPDSSGLFRVRPWATRCSSGYLVNSNFIFKAMDLFERERVPDWVAIDIVYQIVMRKLKVKVFWQHPPSITQGSETGLHRSNFEH